MKIDEAIAELRQDLLDTGEHMTSELRSAQRLGIEALKAVKDARANNYYTPIQPLPGET